MQKEVKSICNPLPFINLSDELPSIGAVTLFKGIAGKTSYYRLGAFQGIEWITPEDAVVTIAFGGEIENEEHLSQWLYLKG